MPSANGQNKACLCGRRAYKFKLGGWVCEKCDDIERWIYRDEQSCLEKKLLRDQQISMDSQT